MSQDEIEAIHNVSLKVLENRCIKLVSRKALDALKEAEVELLKKSWN